MEIRREGDTSSNPILILDDDPSVTITPDVNTPPQTPPEHLEKRPRPESYAGIAARSSSRTKKGSSKSQPLRLSSDLNRNATVSQGASSLDAAPLILEPIIPEEYSPRLNNNMTIINSYLLTKSLVYIIEENLQRASPALEVSPIYERAYPTISANKLASPREGLIALANSFISGSSPEADS